MSTDTFTLLLFLVVMALLVVTGVKIGLRAALAIRDTNRRINADRTALRTRPHRSAPFSDRGCGARSDSASPGSTTGEARPTTAPFPTRNAIIAACDWIWAPALIAAAMLTAGVLAPDARADGHLTGTELVYAATYGTTAICPVIAMFPEPDGVLGVVDGITLDNFTQDDAFDIVGAAVWRFCPEHWPLVVDTFEQSAAGPVIAVGASGGRP